MSENMIIEQPVFGLNNLGNTCFMNAAIQLFLTIQDFIEYLQKDDWMNIVVKKCNGKSEQEIIQLCENYLFITFYKFVFHNKEERVKNPINFIKHCLNKNRNNISIGPQGDSNEFLIMMINTLSEELEDKDEKGKQIKSILDNLLQYSVEKNIECNSCNNIKKIKQNELFIPIYLKSGENQSIQNEINNLKPVDIVNDYKCKCGNNNIEIKSNIENTGKYLLIQIMRFKKNGFCYVKDNTEINIDLELEICNKKYNLTSVVCHSGGLNGGHYYNYSKRNNKWYCFNDSQVTEENENFINLVKSSAYILLYKEK